MEDIRNQNLQQYFRKLLELNKCFRLTEKQSPKQSYTP
jgi:hypothetical protein